MTSFIISEYFQDGNEKELSEDVKNSDQVKFTPDEGVQEVTVKCTAENDVAAVENEHTINILCKFFFKVNIQFFKFIFVRTEIKFFALF